MRSWKKIAIIFIALSVALISILIYVLTAHNEKLEIDKARAEERVKILEGEKTIILLQIDALKKKSLQVDSLIALNKNNEELIKKKYETKRTAVVRLDADESILFFSRHTK